jgi:hypothetical protein
MKTYLFSDDDHFHIEIKAKTVRGALLKARERFGIKVNLRLNQRYHNLYQYRSPTYGCHIIGPV